MRVARVLLLILLLCGGCATTRPGALASVQATSDADRAGNVYLLRGFIGVFSSGINSLTEKLNAAGVRAHVYQDDQWKALAQTIRRRYAEATAREPLVLIGHSYGADDALRIARELEKSGVVVDLLITLDPVTPPRVPKNVRRCRNYFQSNGVADRLPWLRGVPVQASTSDQVMNIDLRKDRRDLLERDTNHFNIEKNQRVHAAVLDDVLQVCLQRTQRAAH